jgi:hypothetical protein
MPAAVPLSGQSDGLAAPLLAAWYDSVFVALLLLWLLPCMLLPLLLV